MEVEKRYLTDGITLAEESGDQYIEGYALIFNSLSNDLGGFREVILPEALNEEIIKGSDIYCFINHNESSGVLARSRYGVGSLSLQVDEKGLKYRFKLGKSYHHQQLAEYLERGEITASSFAFTVLEDEWVNEDGAYIRKIKKFEKLYDVSPVFEPAYSETEVSLRSLNKFKELKKKEEELRKLEKQKEEELEKYYSNLKNKYSYD